MIDSGAINQNAIPEPIGSGIAIHKSVMLLYLSDIKMYIGDTVLKKRCPFSYSFYKVCLYRRAEA